MANSKGLLISGIILGLVGIILFIISFVLFPSFLREATDNSIKDAVIVDSRKSARFNDWAGQKSVDNLFLQYYYAWNLTNPNEFLNGEKPIFKQIGPFNYKYEWSYSNITFIDSGNLVQYVNKKSYIFQEDDDESFDPDIIQITNINPAFLGLLSQLENNAQQIGASSEELLFILGSGPQMGQFIQDLSTDNFTQVAYFFNGPVTFKQRYQLIIESLNVSNPDDYFLNIWANSTIPPVINDYLWTDMLVSLGFDEPLGISLGSARMILDENNTASILNLSDGIFLWLNSTVNSSVEQSLANQLNISTTQLLLIRSWYINQFNPQFTSNYLLEQCNIPTLDYLGLCQFVNTIPLNYQSVSSFNDYLSPNWISSLPTPFEITSLTQSNVSFSVMDSSKYLFSGDYSLLTIKGIAEFASQFNSNQNFTAWNINSNDATVLFSYIFGSLPESYSENFIKSFYSSSGLIVTKSINDWLWNCNDELLQVLGIENNCALQVNNTIFKPSIIFTGKNDSSKTNSYYKYQNQCTISVWNQGNQSVNVTGFAETGQFPPLDGIPESLTIFEENVLRPLELQREGPSQVQGINTQRYYLQNNSFPVSATFNNSINGFANLTGLYQGLPIFVSLWDMYEVPPQYSSDLIQGLNQTFESAQIPLDLEPITGNALYYNLKLQINLAIPNNSNYFQPDGKYSTINIPLNYGIFLPSIKIGQTATPNDDNISLLKSQLKEIQVVKITPVVVFSIFGGILVASGFIMSTVGVRRMFIRRGYHQIS